jgi:hypothetical protein
MTASFRVRGRFGERPLPDNGELLVGEEHFHSLR